MIQVFSLPNQTNNVEQVASLHENLELDNSKYVRFEIPDLHGSSRSKTVPTDKFTKYASKGLNLCSNIFAMDTRSITVEAQGINSVPKSGDILLFPDLKTLGPVSWQKNTVRVICDAYTSADSNQPISIAPRSVLQKLLKLFYNEGFQVMMGHEYEFYLLDSDTKSPLFPGKHVFNTTRNHYDPKIDQILEYLQQSNLDITTYNCESAPSQLEINYSPSIGIEAADKAFFFKNSVKEIAHHLGFLATFMSKPFIEHAGSGCHLHINLINKNTGENLFCKTTDDASLSDLGQAFAQGILEHISSVMAFLAPTPNCYRRLQSGIFAPSNISYGVENRSALLRFKTTRPESTHLEVRAPSALSNPYLCGAAILASGLLGIRHKQKLKSCLHYSKTAELPKLPQSLGEALDCLDQDAEIRHLLGEEFCQLYTTVKRHELKRFQHQVTEWERHEYLEVY